MNRHKRHGHSAPPAPNQEGMERLLSRSGISLQRNQLDQLWAYHNLLRKRNQDRDLTRIIGFEPMVIKHYVDSMIVGDFVRLPSPLIDIGTGAGFPGIPLKIRYPNLHIVFAEPRPRRVDFLKEASKLLGFRNVEFFDHKVVSQSFQKPMAGVITRAVEVIEKTLLRSSGCLTKGGKAIFLKGPNCDEEIREALKRCGKTHRLVSDESYVLPHTPHQRRLVVFQRINENSAEASE